MSEKPSCVICGKPARQKITKPFEVGFILTCDDEQCINSVKIQLEGALRNQN